MISSCARPPSSEYGLGSVINYLFIFSTMDDQHMKDKEADVADEQVAEAEKVAGEAHGSAAEAHEKKAAEEHEESNP